MDIAPENRQITGRGADGRFRAGRSGNPGGRPKGFVGRIKAVTGGDDYPKLVKGFAVIAFGTAKQREMFFGGHASSGRRLNAASGETSSRR